MGQPLQSLLTLQEYIDGGHDLVDARIAVVVKALGHRKTSQALTKLLLSI